MREHLQCAPGLIGPNAVLQLLPVLERVTGAERCAQILANAGIFQLPDGQSMIPETEAARLHKQLRREEPDRASYLSAQAGAGTGDYILRHRIPQLAQTVLRFLPPSLSARLLSRAIAQHAWTFVGSGALRVVTPWIFEIEGNPLIKGESCEGCLCSWHEGVFSRLYQSLVALDAHCIETHCGAQIHSNCCRFELVRGQTS